MTHPKRRSKYAAIVVTVVAVGLAASCSAAGRPQEADSYSSIADRVADYAGRVAEDADVPAIAIGIITRDGLVEERYIGTNAVDAPVTAETMFEIGSSSKAFLGVTEAILVDRGDIDWNDRVVDHHPDFEMFDSWVTNEFRVADLLAQRSGLHDSAAQLAYFFGLPWEDSVEALRYLEPVSSFRSEFAYQNIPHFVAGEIVADKTDADTWNEAVEQLIFDPLGMTGTVTDSEVLAGAPNTTRGHTMRDGQVHESPYFPPAAQGAGSIVSNLQDMSKWIAMHLSQGEGPEGELVSAEQLEETYRVRVPVTDPYYTGQTGLGTDRLDIGYATGWFVHSLPEGRVIEHGGNTYGYNSAVMFDPDREVGLVVLSNQGFAGGQATHLGKYGMDAIQDREPLDYHARAQETLTAAEAEAEGMPDEQAENERPAAWYAGAYEHPLLGVLALREDGDELLARIGPEGFDGTARRLEGDAFDLTWYLDGSPESGFPLNYEIRFDPSADPPDRLTIDGFTFQRTS